MTTTLSKKEFKILIRESVREALENEMMRLRALALPEVSDKEQKDIERRYRFPSGRYVKRHMITI